LLDDLLCDSDEQTLSHVNDLVFVNILFFIFLLVVITLWVLRLICTLALFHLFLRQGAL
jgi:hypothetical protein